MFVGKPGLLRHQMQGPCRVVEKVDIPSTPIVPEVPGSRDGEIRIRSGTCEAATRHCERKRSNPEPLARTEWIASSLTLLAMTDKRRHFGI
jgi:hypothetical protein